MSFLSLSFDELRRVDVEIRLKNTDGSLFFNLEPLLKYKTSTAFSSVSELYAGDIDAGCLYSAYSINFQTGCDHAGPYLRIFPSLDTSPGFDHPNSGGCCQGDQSSFFQQPNLPSLSGRGHPVENSLRFGGFPSSPFDVNTALPKSTPDYSPVWPPNSGFPPLYDPRPLSPTVLINEPVREKGLFPSLFLGVGQTSPSHLSSGTSSSASESLFPAADISRENSSPASSSLSRWIPDPSDGISAQCREPSGLQLSEGEDGCGKSYACGISGCTRRFKSQHTLRSHMEAHKQKRPTVFTCTQGCFEQFTRQHDRLRHEVAKHGKVSDWQCEDCRRSFSSKKTLAHHKCPMMVGRTRWVN